MEVNINILLEIGSAVASLFAAYMALSTKATMLELKLWVTDNFERRRPVIEKGD